MVRDPSPNEEEDMNFWEWLAVNGGILVIGITIVLAGIVSLFF